MWSATSNDVPGRCVQAASFDELAGTVAARVPEWRAPNAAGERIRYARTPENR